MYADHSCLSLKKKQRKAESSCRNADAFEILDAFSEKASAAQRRSIWGCYRVGDLSPGSPLFVCILEKFLWII